MWLTPKRWPEMALHGSFATPGPTRPKKMLLSRNIAPHSWVSMEYGEQFSRRVVAAVPAQGRPVCVAIFGTSRLGRNSILSSGSTAA
jgi:hypothetical protein